MPNRRTYALHGTFFLGALCALVSAASAQYARAPQAGQTPSLRILDNGLIEINADPSRPLLLLAGEGFLGPEDCGRRVAPQRVQRVPLDPAGRCLLPLAENRGRLMLQAWQPPAAGEALGQGYSVPVTLLGSGASQSLASAAHVGDLVVTEFMKDPSEVTDGNGEWIELYNNRNWRLDIEGVTVTDFSGASFVLSNGGMGIFLAPGERYVLGNNDDPATNGGVPVDYRWSGFSLKNSSDQILLYGTNGNLIDAVTYDNGVRWPDSPGMSISLTGQVIDPQLNNNPALWCHSSTTMGVGSDTGTPGAANEDCP